MVSIGISLARRFSVRVRMVSYGFVMCLYGFNLSPRPVVGFRIVLVLVCYAVLRFPYGFSRPPRWFVGVPVVSYDFI